jgi:hypothetical protein
VVVVVLVDGYFHSERPSVIPERVKGSFSPKVRNRSRAR